MSNNQYNQNYSNTVTSTNANSNARYKHHNDDNNIDNYDVVNSYSTNNYNNGGGNGPEEISIHFTKNSSNIIKQKTSIRKPPARGDSVKKIQTLTRFNSSKTIGGDGTIDNNNIVKKPVTVFEKFQAWMINEGNRKIFATIWFLIHGLIFSMACIRYYLDGNLTTARRQLGITFTIAKASALVLHVDAAFILFPVCRNLISLVRTTPLNNVIPFDKNIQFHKLIGFSIVFFTIVHTVSHWINFYRLAIIVNQGGVLDFLKLNFASGPGATGYVMLICLLIMVSTSSKKARTQNFNTFWLLHHLFIPFFGVWAFHGAFCMIRPDREPFCDDIASFWKYWIASGVIYISERVLREVRARQKTDISKVIMHPSKVIEIQMKKESIMTKAGQYVFICCPEISLWEWHPFTLTSAPEEDYISIHVRILGDFTQSLASKLGCDYTNEAKLREKNKDRLKSIYDGIDLSLDNPGLQKALPRIMVDGPYGSASEDVFKFEVAILVGAGIGITPFASILKSIWYRVTYPTKSTQLRKVYFFWVSRDYESFEWFQSLLLAIEEQDIDQFIEIHTYLTGSLRKSEIGNIFTNDDGNIKDTITGLKSPTHFGRPNWDKIFSNMRSKYPETDVGVFFCGPKALDKTLHNKCNLWSDVSDNGTRFFYGKG